MDNTANSNNKLLYYARWGGAAAIQGGVLLILATVIFVLTHGTQSEAQNGTLFGLRSVWYARIFQPAIWLSFLLGVIGINALQGGRARQLGKAGFIFSLRATWMSPDHRKQRKPYENKPNSYDIWI
jgi:hypothetical protein